ncbi:MAG: SbcC/MukB-like Walker B domain-containing protein, partial [Candidatus Sericytochromatia bacterium]
ELKASREAEAVHMEKAHAERALEDRWRALDREAEGYRLKALAERHEREAWLARARVEAASLEATRAERDEVEAAIVALAVLAVEQDRAREKGIRFRARQEALAAEADRARAAARAKEERLEALEASLAVHAARRGDGHDHEAGCPLCAGALEGPAIGRVRARLRSEAEGYAAEAERIGDEVTRLDHDRLAARARYAELADQLRGRESLWMRLGALDERLVAIAAAARAVEELEAELEASPALALPEGLAAAIAEVEQARVTLAYDPAALAVLQAKRHDLRWAESRHVQIEHAARALAKLEARLPEAEAALGEQDAHWAAEAGAIEARLAALEAEREAVAYDEAAHRAVRRALAALAGTPERWNALTRQALWLDSARELLARLDRDRDQQAALVAKHQTALTAIAASLEEAHQQEREAAEADRLLQLMRQEERSLAEARGRLEAEQAQLTAMAERLADREAARQAAVADASAYQALTAAFGKDGIQALMIENAIPEIEEEANRLLSRMSDNRMHLRLATQREKKTGGVHETLEIHIADELGIRPYELYSGGEAFRVDFAVRLALSKLLTRRAGARLQTLVIDEGFGSQDAQGRERLLEAINAVSGDFARILVITHIRELKEAFNAQIEVAKRGGVSEVRLVS